MNLKLNAALEAAQSTATLRKQCENSSTCRGRYPLPQSGFGSGAAHEVTQTCIKMPVLLCRLACVEVSLYCALPLTLALSLSVYLLLPPLSPLLSLSLWLRGCATASVLRASASPRVCCETQTASETPLKPALPCLPRPLPPPPLSLPAVAHNLLQFAASTFLSIFSVLASFLMGRAIWQLSACRGARMDKGRGGKGKGRERGVRVRRDGGSSGGSCS